MKILLLLVALSLNNQTPCKGTTKTGKPCQSVIVSKETGYCNAHDPNREKCHSLNAQGKPCGMIPLKDGQFCRVHNLKPVKK